jgi:DNA-binding transcriptional MerR regulator
MLEPIRHMPRLGLGNATRLYGLTARALRFYEQLGLIEAGRDRLNTRYYDAEARRRLDWIVPLRRAGVPLGEIRNILRAEEQSGRGRECAIRAVERREAALKVQLTQVAEARNILRGQIGNSSLHIAAADASPPPPAKAHA